MMNTQPKSPKVPNVPDEVWLAIASEMVQKEKYFDSMRKNPREAVNQINKKYFFELDDDQINAAIDAIQQSGLLTDYQLYEAAVNFFYNGDPTEPGKIKPLVC